MMVILPVYLFVYVLLFLTIYSTYPQKLVIAKLLLLLLVHLDYSFNFQKNVC